MQDKNQTLNFALMKLITKQCVNSNSHIFSSDTAINVEIYVFVLNLLFFLNDNQLVR